MREYFCANYLEELKTLEIHQDDMRAMIMPQTVHIDIIFIIHDIDENIMIDFNANDTVGRKRTLKELQGNIQFQAISSNVFYDNLIFIDSKMPDIIAYSLLYGYIYNISRATELANLMQSYNPLKCGNNKIYEYKYKKCLSSIVLEQLPNSNWLGDNHSYGCVVAKIEKIILVYDSRNRVGFENFLFNHSVIYTNNLDTSEYPKIYKNKGKYYMRLNLQIGFEA